MKDDEKKQAIKEAAEFGAAYYTALIEERMTRDDAMAMANNFVIMFLLTRGVIQSPPDNKEPWQK